MYDYIIATDEGGSGQDDGDSRDSDAEDQTVEEEDGVFPQTFMRQPYSFSHIS